MLSEALLKARLHAQQTFLGYIELKIERKDVTKVMRQIP